MITSKTNKKIRVGIRAAVQKSNLDRGGENMKKKEQKKVLIQKGMTVGMIFFLLLAAEGCQKKDTSVTDPSDSNIKQEETQKNTDQKNEDSDTEKSDQNKKDESSSAEDNVDNEEKVDDQNLEKVAFLTYEEILSDETSIYDEDQLKKAKDEVTEFYKALKSLLDNIKTLRKEYDIADFTKEFDLIVEKEKKREEYEEQIKALRLKISELEKSKEDINKRKNSLLQELTKCQAEEKQRVDEKKSLCEQFPDNFNESEDYQSALKTTESEKNILTEKYENWKKSEQEVQASLQKVSGSLQTQENCLKSSQEKQREAYAVYLKELERLGLSPDFDVEKNLMEEDKKQSLLEKVNSYKESLKDIDTQKTYLKGKIKDQTFDEKEWKDLIEALSTSKESLLNYRKKIAVYESQSTDIQKRLAQKDEINAKYQQIIHRRSIIRELEELFKGNAFIEYVAESRLRYIAKEASSILSHISNGNYTLDVNDATEFVIRDNKNGGVLRAADTLSGGEIFITSLSLALALSSSIQLNGSAPLELFFLDEGFGSLDDELLNIVMDSLERIKTDRRSIGIISHVENLKERVPVKLLIEPSQNTGSGSHIRVQYS